MPFGFRTWQALELLSTFVVFVRKRNESSFDSICLSAVYLSSWLAHKPRIPRKKKKKEKKEKKKDKKDKKAKEVRMVDAVIRLILRNIRGLKGAQGREAKVWGFRGHGQKLAFAAYLLKTRLLLHVTYMSSICFRAQGLRFFEPLPGKNQKRWRQKCQSATSLELKL